MKEIITTRGTVVLQPDTTIDISKNNPLFTRAEEFSIELTIPRKTNEHIFGYKYRLAGTGAGTPIDCRFVFGGREKLSGTIELVSASEDSYDVILKGSRNNFMFSFGALKLRELDFGSQDIVPDIYPLTPTEEEIVAAMKLSLSVPRDWITFPVYNAGGDKWLNKWSFDTGTFMTGGTELRAPFMRLHRILELLFEMKGYTIVSNWFTENDEKKNIVIYNATTNVNTGIVIKDMLPDWTVLDFLSEIEDFFPVTIFINSRNKTVNIFADDGIIASTPVARLDSYVLRDYKIVFNDKLSGYKLSYDLPSDDNTTDSDWEFADEAINPELVNTPADLLLPVWGGRLKLVVSTGEYYLAEIEDEVVSWVYKGSMALNVRSGKEEVERKTKIYPLLTKAQVQREVVDTTHPQLAPERVEVDFTLAVPSTSKVWEQWKQDFRPMIYRGLDTAPATLSPGYTTTYRLYPAANFVNWKMDGTRWANNVMELRWDGDQGLRGPETIAFLDGAERIEAKLIINHVELENIDLTKVYTLYGRKVIISELVVHYGRHQKLEVDAVLLARREEQDSGSGA